MPFSPADAEESHSTERKGPPAGPSGELWAPPTHGANSPTAACGRAPLQDRGPLLVPTPTLGCSIGPHAARRPVRERSQTHSFQGSRDALSEHGLENQMKIVA